MPCLMRTVAICPCISFAIALFFPSSYEHALFLWNTDVTTGLWVGVCSGGNQSVSRLGVRVGSRRARVEGSD